jgi:tetratricopeptide (TPR) repeat protein
LDHEGDIRDFAADYDGAVECWNRCSKLFEAAGYPRHAVWIECKLAGTEILVGRYADAQARKERTLARAREVGDDNSVGMYLKEFAVDALHRGEFEEAIRLAEEAVAAFRRTGESVTLSHALIVLANTHLAINELSASREAVSEAKQLDSEPFPEYQERLEILQRHIVGQVDGRHYFNHLAAED